MVLYDCFPCDALILGYYISNSASEGGLRRVLHVLKVRQEVLQHLAAPAPFPEPQTPPHRPPSVHMLATALHSPASPSVGGERFVVLQNGSRFRR